MQKILYELFSELGMPDYALGVKSASHKFTLKNYMQIFEMAIQRRDLIVDEKRIKEMRNYYIEKKGEYLYGGFN